MKIISLGWGTQSFTLACMVALGELEPVDFAIHADTTHERKETYDLARRWTPWLEDHGVKIVTVSNPQSYTNLTSNKTDIPAFTKAGESRGQLRRQCTQRWKIVPMRWAISAELKKAGLKKKPGIVEQWIGISLDEYQRMKESDVKFVRNRWPLIERKMTRHDCQVWLEKHGFEIPVRSACVFCPYHSIAELRDIKVNSPDAWEHAVDVDFLIRKTRPPYDLFVSNKLKPLPEIDTETPQDKGQLSLWENECSGVCGV